MPTVVVKPTRVTNDWLDGVYEIDENLTSSRSLYVNVSLHVLTVSLKRFRLTPR